MKFLISMHYSPPHIGGMETIVEKQLESIKERGNEVTLLTCRHDKNLPQHDRRSGHELYRFRTLNFIEKKFGVTYPIFSPFSFFRIKRYVHQSDIVHIHDVFYELSHLTGLAAICAKKPLYITQHVAMVDHPNKLVTLLQKVVYRTVGKYLFKNAERIVVYNSNVRDFLAHLGIDRKKILLLHNGIDTSFFRPATSVKREQLRIKYDLPPNVPIVLFVGRLVPKKGFDILAQAHSKNYLTLIIGNGIAKRELSSLPDVKMYGPAQGNELLELYQLSDIFAFPATGEIFTLVMQEAMACGLPILTANDPGYNNYDLDETLISLVNRRPDAIRNRLNELVVDKAMLEKMAKYSRKLAVDKFSWHENYHIEYAIYNLS